MANLMAWWMVHRTHARGSVNFPTILWIVIGVLVAGGVVLWLTAGGGLTAIKNLLTNVTNFFNTQAQTL
ncbi:hypothetical protein [Sulfobacillus thermosulfidooxidans]|uniref:hypothetical protein n=1 Tax=Sulfobacillus thermosulfidooxidans TaxID=28034 RepID=UPI0002E54AB5|nr:hypothetical protein [Sulfobacillus thermosulfidooxidans]